MPTSLKLSTRAIEPKTYDAETRSAVAILATEEAVYSTDSQTGRAILEVWRMDGMEPVDQVPLLDTHDRENVDCVLGSITEIRVKGEQLLGRVSIASTEIDTATKVSEGHIRDVSSGIQPLEVVVIRAGESGEVGGKEYTAPSESDLRIVTRWRLREVSLCPIGADSRAKIRSLQKECSNMGAQMRGYLEKIGLPNDASDDDARAFYEALPEAARKRADAYVVEISEEEEESEVESEGSPAMREDAKDDEEKERMETVEGEDEAKMTTKSAREKTSQRSSGVKRERERVAAIHELSDGVPAETVRKAINDGWTQEKAAMEFLKHVRGERQRAVPPGESQRSPAIHSRSKEQDATPEVLGLALALRSVDNERLWKQRQKGDYQANGSIRHGAGDFTYRKAYEGSNRQDKQSELFEKAHRFQHLALADVVRLACEIDGQPQSFRHGLGESLRTAVSGSALASIFTTNFNAQFMTGYVDFADSTTEWCNSEDVVNFMTREVATMGKFAGLKKLARGQTAEDANINDWKESYKIARYANRFTVDEQDLIDDRFGALDMTAPMDLGLAAAQLRPNLVYSEILNNAALDVDGVNLFDASSHKNYATTSSALDASTLQAGISAIAAQRIQNRVLNLQPKFLIVPQALRFTSEILVQSPQRIIASASGGTLNPLQGLLGVIADDRIGASGVIDPRTDAVVAGSATNWLLVCKPGDQGAKTVMVGYLQGSGRAPRVRSFILDRGQWGMGWDVSFDLGVKALDYRAMYFATGAGA